MGVQSKMKQSERQCNMDRRCIDTDCVEMFEEDDAPEYDYMFNNMIRQDERDTRKKELRKQEKRVMR